MIGLPVALIVKKKVNTHLKDLGYSFLNGLDYNIGRNSLKLQLDNGKFVQFGAPWCGHFETLVSVEIVTENHKIYL